MSALVLVLTLAAASAAEDQKPYLSWGKEIFETHCSPCHGKDATGNGPAARGLKSRPADLTRISERHGGTFPRLDIVRFIEDDRRSAAHTSEMPAWRTMFRKRFPRSFGATGASPEAYAVTDFLASIQTAK